MNNVYSVEGFLESNISFENYALECPPELPTESWGNALEVFHDEDHTKPPPAISDSVIQWIKVALKRMRFKGSNVLVQLWAPYESASNDSVYVFKTSNQPYGVTDLNPELLSCRIASLEKEYHVNFGSKQANGLIGNVFLNGSPGWTSNNGGHLAIPVFEDDGHFPLGVLEIVTTIEKESYDWEFIESCRALQGVNLRSYRVLFPSMNELGQGSKPNVKANVGEGGGQRKKPRKRASEITREDITCLFHMPIAAAANELGICANSLRKVYRKFRMTEWPYEKKSRGSSTPSLSTNGEEDDGGSTSMEHANQGRRW